MDPIDYLREEMEKQGIEQRDLIGIFGSRARTCDVLNRHRALSITMIRDLCTALDLDANKLIKRYEVEPYKSEKRNE